MSVSGKEELMKFLSEQIYEQKKGFEGSVQVQCYLIELQEKLKSSASYEDFLKKLVQEEGDEEMSSTYRAITDLIKAVLKECCDSKTKAEYLMTFMKGMFSELNEAVKASRVYERIKG